MTPWRPTRTGSVNCKHVHLAARCQKLSSCFPELTSKAHASRTWPVTDRRAKQDWMRVGNGFRQERPSRKHESVSATRDLTLQDSSVPKAQQGASDTKGNIAEHLSLHVRAQLRLLLSRLAEANEQRQRNCCIAASVAGLCIGSQLSGKKQPFLRTTGAGQVTQRRQQRKC